MKLIVKLIIIIWANLLTANAQQMALEWQSSLGGNKNEDAFDLIRTDDEGFIVVGSTNSKNSFDIAESRAFEGNGGSDFWIFKTDKNGKLLWSKTFGGSSDDIATSVTRASNGDYVILGTTLSTDFDANFNGPNGGLLMVRLNTNGNLISKRVFPGGKRYTDLTYTFTDNFSKPIIRTLPSGELMIAATREIGTSNYTGKDFFIAKLTPTGDNLWEKTFGTRYNEQLADMILTSDNSMLLVGSTDALAKDLEGAGNGQTDFFAMKITQGGVEIWKKAWGGSGVDVLRTVVENSSKNAYIVAGETLSKDGVVSNPLGEKDGFTMKIDLQGNLVWKKSFGGSNNDGIYRLLPVAGEGYMALGTSDSEISNATQKGPLTDVWTTNFDESGNIINSGLYGGADIDVARAGIAISAKEWVLVGLSRSDTEDLTQNKGGNDVWILKLTPPPPITFRAFYANLDENNNALVEFVTSYQQNAQLISLEKSIDNVNFGKITDFSGLENAKNPKKYGFTDQNLSFGITYYRLVYYDTNNKLFIGPKISFEYLPLATAPIINESLAKIYPNPAVNFIQYDLKEPEATLAVYNQYGRQVPVFSYYSPANGWRIVLQNQVSPGLYFLKATKNNLLLSTDKFMVH